VKQAYLMSGKDSDKHSDQFKSFTDIFKYTDKTIFGTKTFLSANKDRVITYGQLLTLTAKLCKWFEDNGLKQNDRVVLISKDDVAITLLFMACLRYGLTAVILNQNGSKDELNTLINAAKPKALFFDEMFFEHLNIKDKDYTCMKITPGEKHKKPGMFDKFFDKSDGKKNENFPYFLHHIEEAENPDEITVPLETVAYILFTSGTTSRPKGVEITHGNLLAQMQTFVRQYDYTQHSHLLNILPLHHTDGLTQGPVVAFTTGAAVHRPFRFSIDKLNELIEAIYRYKITNLIAVPSMLQLIDTMDNDADEAFNTDSFKFIISTAGYLDPNLWERFEKRFHTKLINVYGLTETVCEALYCGPDENTRKLGTIGKPVDTEIRIVDDKEKDVKEGEAGEIWLKGPHIMKGYFEMPEETAEVLTDDGWFKTGDLGQKDSDGFYSIVGRKKNLIIVGGINVYPDDVANVLRSMPGVLDAVAWGEEDETWGEIVVAAVLPDENAQLDTNAISEDFLNHASVEKLPRKIHVVKEFPRGPAGKVVLRELQEAISNNTQIEASNEAVNEDDIKSKVIAIAAKAFKCSQEKLNVDSTAETTKGWNSLAHIEFLLSLEKEYSIKMDPKDILKVRSISDALEIVETKIKKAA
jgi:long-chain acyl-CoA synthetase